MEIRIEETKKYLKVEKIAKKELIIRMILLFFIVLYFFIYSYMKYGKITLIFVLFTSPAVVSFCLASIIKYPYEVLIIKNGRIIRYVSLFYRHLRWCKIFTYLDIYNIDELKNIYFKNTTEIFVSKVLKRTESPYHKIHLIFKDENYKGFGIKLKDKDAKNIVLIINKFLQKYKNDKSKIKILQEESLIKNYKLDLEERYICILNKILDEDKLFLLKKDNNYIINGDNEVIKNLEMFKNINFEEINFYVFYVNYLSKKEYENQKVLVGYNGIDGKEVTMLKLKEDINEIRDSKNSFK